MKKNTIALMIAASLMAGYMPVEVFATENMEVESFSEAENKKYANGTYTVSNKSLKIDSDDQSSASKYVNGESRIIISDDGIKATLEFTEKNIMTNIRIKVNGHEVQYTQKETGDKSIELEFNLSSLEDSIEVGTTINLGFHVMPVSFRVVLDTESIEPLPDNSGSEEDTEQGSENKPDNGDKEEDGDDSGNTPNNPDEEEKNENVEDNSGNNNQTGGNNSDNNTPNTGNDNTPSTDSGNGQTIPGSNDVQAPTASENTNTTIYKIQNEILSSSAIGYSAARAAVSNTSYLEVINGVTYVTLGLSQLDVMTNIKVSVDGSNVNYETVRSSSANNIKDIRFKVASESSTITLSAYITMSDMNISFGVDLLESTKEQISKTQASQSLGTPGNLAVTTPSSSNGSNNSSNSGNTSTAKSSTTSNKSGENEEGSDLEEIEATEYFKKYTIENEVVSDSAIGKMMVKKYLDSTSTLEEIDGKYYLTLTFVGTSAMDNIKIMVNGEEVEYSMKNISDDNKGTSTFKFEIGNVNDEITMSMLIVPINSTIEFGISLLEDTLTLVEEGTVSKDEREEESSVQTLSSINTTSNNGGTSIFKTIIISTLTTIATIVVLGGAALAVISKRKENIK